jgi:hypothetical protein
MQHPAPPGPYFEAKRHRGVPPAWSQTPCSSVPAMKGAARAGAAGERGGGACLCLCLCLENYCAVLTARFLLPAACCVLCVCAACAVCAVPRLPAAPRLPACACPACRACPAAPASCLPGLPAWPACLACLPGLPACPACLASFLPAWLPWCWCDKTKSSLLHAAREKVPCRTRQEKKFLVTHGKRKNSLLHTAREKLVAHDKRKSSLLHAAREKPVARDKRKSSLLHAAREKVPCCTWQEKSSLSHTTGEKVPCCTRQEKKFLVAHDKRKSSLLHATRENQGQGKARSKLSCWCCPADGAAGLRRLVLLPHFLRRLGPPQPNARELMNLALMKPRMEEERKTARERASCKEEEQISAAQVRARSTFLTKTIFTDSAQGTENEDRKNKSRKGETDTAREEDKRERKRERRQLRRWET